MEVGRAEEWLSVSTRKISSVDPVTSEALHGAAANHEQINGPTRRFVCTTDMEISVENRKGNRVFYLSTRLEKSKISVSNQYKIGPDLFIIINILDLIG